LKDTNILKQIEFSYCRHPANVAKVINLPIQLQVSVVKTAK